MKITNCLQLFVVVSIYSISRTWLITSLSEKSNNRRAVKRLRLILANNGKNFQLPSPKIDWNDDKIMLNMMLITLMQCFIYAIKKLPPWMRTLPIFSKGIISRNDLPIQMMMVIIPFNFTHAMQIFIYKPQSYNQYALQILFLTK